MLYIVRIHELIAQYSLSLLLFITASSLQENSALLLVLFTTNTP